MFRPLRLVVSLVLLGSLFAAPGPADATVVLFSDDFEDEDLGGGLYYPPPGGWLLFNVDGRTPDEGVSYVRQAWVVRNDLVFDRNDQIAVSTSWYSPVGQADDWMWSPQFALSDHASLSWDAIAHGTEAYRDGYEVRIMTGTGDPNADPSASTVIFSTAAENTTWTSRSVDLDALGYTSGTARIGFRNNSDDKYLLGIDDVVVTGEETVDAPTITGSDPTSPSTWTTPRIIGSAQSGSTVRLYATSDCTGSPIGQGTATQFAAQGIEVTLPADATTSIRGTATSDSLVTSNCSAPFVFRTDNTDPVVTIDGPPVKRTRTGQGKVVITFTADEPSSLTCAVDGGVPVPCVSSFATEKLAKGPHVIRVEATDAVGNVGSSEHRVRLAKKRR